MSKTLLLSLILKSWKHIDKQHDKKGCFSALIEENSFLILYFTNKDL